jgi:DNA processing protein
MPGISLRRSFVADFLREFPAPGPRVDRPPSATAPQASPAAKTTGGRGLPWRTRRLPDGPGSTPGVPVLGRHGRRIGRRPEPLGALPPRDRPRGRSGRYRASGRRFPGPGDEHWPTGLDDLPDAPYGLWYRGNLSGIPAPSRCAALTGSRDSTSYAAAVTGDIAYGLAQRGVCVISGLAYGIDTDAHRAALAGSTNAGPATIAVLAGGLDRDYPSGNADLAAAIRANGLTLSELPPGTAPTRARFLTRNRIIAALAGVTCVVEARWRSGALNTAHHAETIARHVTALPGSVHSANSAGCHRLLKEGGAVLVTDTAEVIELLAS